MCPPVQGIDVPSRRFSHVLVDLVGPLPSVHGYTHVFTVVDRSTHWPAAYPIQDTSTTACINALVECISSFGVPATITLLRSRSWLEPGVFGSLEPEKITQIIEAKGPRDKKWKSLSLSLSLSLSIYLSLSLSPFLA